MTGCPVLTTPGTNRDAKVTYSHTTRDPETHLVTNYWKATCQCGWECLGPSSADAWHGLDLHRKGKL